MKKYINSLILFMFLPLTSYANQQLDDKTIQIHKDKISKVLNSARNIPVRDPITGEITGSKIMHLQQLGNSNLKLQKAKLIRSNISIQRPQ